MVRLRQHGSGGCIKSQNHGSCVVPLQRGDAVSSRTKLFWTVASVVAVIVALAMAVSICRRVESNSRSACIGHLYQLGLILRTYALDHGGIYPDKWTAITDGLDDSDMRLFLPPRSHSSPGERATVDSWTHYTLVPGRSVSDYSNSVLAFGPCPEGGGCILFVDGRVKWQSSLAFPVTVSRREGSGERDQIPTTDRIHPSE